MPRAMKSERTGSQKHHETTPHNQYKPHYGKGAAKGKKKSVKPPQLNAGAKEKTVATKKR